MIIKIIPSYMFITQIEEHEEYKDRLLSMIDEMPDSSYETVTRTDWNVPPNMPRDYLMLFYREILEGKNKYLDKQKEFYEADEWKIGNGWYQQYDDYSHHIWHNHAEASFANVYFLELPTKEHRTEIKDVEYDADEGYLITFPAMLQHRCKPLSGGRKTIISFNTSFTIDNRYL